MIKANDLVEMCEEPLTHYVLVTNEHIEELEQQLREAQEAVWVQSEEAEGLRQRLEIEQQKRQDARDAAEVAMAAATCYNVMSAELVEQRDNERQARQGAESAVRIAADALAWYAMSDPECADEAMDEIEKLLSSEALVRIFRRENETD